MVDPIGPEEMMQILDQMSAALTNTAKVLWDYKIALMKEGFTEDQAMILVVNYQSNIMGSSH